MRKKITISLLALLMTAAASSAMERRDTLQVLLQDEITAEYLDTVNLERSHLINDYHMIGVQYGVSLSRMMFNPVKNETFLFQPINYGIVFTHYGKMFGYMPYFGYQIGVFYGRDGYKTKANKEGVLPTVDGMNSAVYEYVEVPAMAHMHFDVSFFKLMVNIGLYGGYRLSVHRTIAEGWENFTFNVNDPYKPAELEDDVYGKDFSIKKHLDTFYPFENRFDYGIKGGIGFAFMFDPIEIHFTGHVRWAMSSLYQQDYYSPYYYRFANPLDFIFSVGIHYQITKRRGKTSRQLREEARRMVYSEDYFNQRPSLDIQYETDNGQSR